MDARVAPVLRQETAISGTAAKKEKNKTDNAAAELEIELKKYM